MISLTTSAKDLPSGFKSWGKDVDPRCGKIAMPADWTEIINKEKLSFTPTPEDKKYGYIIFRKHYMEPTSPYTVPHQNELIKDIRIFASTGEYEPAVFLLYALQPLRKINVEVSDLRNDKTDSVIGAENIDLRSAVALPFKSLSSSKKYKLKNEILVKKENLNIKSGKTSLFWLTVHVPQSCKAGIYRGLITINTETSTRKIPLLLRVFPIKLVAPDVEFGMHIGNHQTNSSMRQKMFTDMREHGMNTIAPSNYSVYPSWENGKITLSFGVLDRDVNLYKSVGFRRPLSIDMRQIQAWLSCLQSTIDNFRKKGKAFPANYYIQVKSFDVSPKFTDFETKAYVDIVKRIVKHARKNNYPPLYFLAQEESTNKGVRIQQLNHFSKLLKKCGVKTISWSNAPWSGGDDLQLIDPYIDIRYYNYITPQIRKRTKKSGDFFGIYNHGGRLAFGFFGRKVNAEGVLQWAYSWRSIRNMLGNGSGYYGSGKVYFGADGPLPSPTWEEIREGIDDAKYINTLELLIKQNLKSADFRAREHAKQAQKVLDEIIAQIPDNTLDLDKKLKSTDSKQWDVWRFKIIRQILKLQKDSPLKNKTEIQSANKKFINIIPLESNQKTDANVAMQASEQLVIPYVKGGVALDPAMRAAAWQKAVKTKFFVLTNEHAWKRVRAIAAEQTNKPGRMIATQTTFARLFYDDDNIYIGFRCNEDQMDKIVTNVKKRNNGPVWSDDAVEIFIKPSLSSNTTYQIAGNSLAVTAEMKWMMLNGKRTLVRGKNKAWTPNFQVKASKDATGWNIVFKIPFRELGLKSNPGVGAVWRFNLGREEQPQAGCEYSSWSKVEKSFHEVHNWGILFFSRMPEVMISSMTTNDPRLGGNELTVKLQKNKAGEFRGTLTIYINGKSQIIPVCIKQKFKSLIIPYKLEKAGEINIGLKLFSEKKSETIFSTSGKYFVPEVINLKLLQNEIVSGDTFQILLTLNVSQMNLNDYYAELCLKKGAKKYKQKINFTASGKQKIIINTKDLPHGSYTLLFTLHDKKNPKTVSINKQFSIIEGIF
jgi:hypothetical protein